jgi:hypothetical protein
MSDDNTKRDAEPSPASAGSHGFNTESRWRQVAMRFGELLAGSGPSDYYDFTPDEWLEWASASIVTDEDRQKASEAVMRACLDRATTMLTDEEREAILAMACHCDTRAGLEWHKYSATFRLLLERTK